MVRKSPQMVQNIYGTKSLWYEKSGSQTEKTIDGSVQGQWCLLFKDPRGWLLLLLVQPRLVR